MGVARLCDRRRYPTEAKAHRALWVMKTNRRPYAGSLEPIACGLCGGFHLARRRTRPPRGPDPRHVQRPGPVQLSFLKEAS